MGGGSHVLGYLAVSFHCSGSVKLAPVGTGKMLAGQKIRLSLGENIFLQSRYLREEGPKTRERWET